VGFLAIGTGIAAAGYTARAENTSDENSQQLRATMLLADRVIMNDYTIPAMNRQFDQIIINRPSGVDVDDDEVV
jgi:hypothetical protein